LNTSSRHSLLVVDDEPDLRTLYEITLAREGYDVECAATVQEAAQALASRRFQAVITDMRLPDGTGLDLLRELDRAGGKERAIVITAYGSAENAVEALKAGAFDYLTKPVDLRQFRAVVASAVGRDMSGAPVDEAGAVPPSARERRLAGAGRRALERLVGDSAAIRQVRSLIDRVARSMAPVLVQGESGTGKELVARAIHECSSRAAMPFVAVNCGAIPDALLEAEFFGYRKGAFTGALEDREGFFQAAAGGTLFLDEIGDLPLLMQSKLLRVIQERAVRPVGATTEAPVDVRIISATHRDLVAEVRAGRFRQDLFYRLDVIRIGLPPLRERPQDLPAICASLLERIAREAGLDPVPRVGNLVLQQLASHRFPGNVRELENLLHRALALSAGVEITLSDLSLPETEPGDLGGEGAEPLRATRAAPVVSEALATRMSDGPKRFEGPLPADLASYLDAVERQILEEALMRHRFNRTAAGASLGMSLRQIRYRMARLGIHAGADPAEPSTTA
jgi:two-component system response regulator PilR (NtrC family)